MQLVDVARGVHGRLSRKVDIEVARIASIDDAREGDLTFLPSAELFNRLKGCRATAIIVDESAVPHCGRCEPIIVTNVLVAAARAGSLLPLRRREYEAIVEPPPIYAYVDDTAVIDESATLGCGVTIGAATTIAAGCRIGDGVRIGAYCTIGPNSTIEAAANVGNRVRLGASCAIGGEAFLYVEDSGRWLRVPALASVHIGDDSQLASFISIDRGTHRDTSLGRGVILDSQIHIGHGVVIGEDTAIAAGTAIAGETVLGRSCMIGGKVGIGEGVIIADHVKVTAMSMVTKSLLTAGSSHSSGWPVRPSLEWWRFMSGLLRMQRRR